MRAPQNAPRAVNFGPDPASFCTVREVVDAFGARFAGKPGWVRDPAPQPPEAQALTLSSALARALARLASQARHPRVAVVDGGLVSGHSAGENMRKFSEAQIARYRA